MEFGWDEKKNAANVQKHGLSFELAALLFRAPTVKSLITGLIMANNEFGLMEK